MSTLTTAASTVYSSPIGDLLLTSDRSSLTGLYFLDKEAPSSRRDSTLVPRLQPGSWEPDVGVQREVADDEVFNDLTTQLDEYFSGTRQQFELNTLSLRLDGTVFQKRVWNELCRIPYGQTISYGELANRIGQPTAFRAVGLANGRNPISILVPCHRVIGTNGKLVGYGGGLDRKKKLLEIENAMQWES